jgi:hypothetical protein
VQPSRRFCFDSRGRDFDPGPATDNGGPGCARGSGYQPRRCAPPLVACMILLRAVGERPQPFVGARPDAAVRGGWFRRTVTDIWERLFRWAGPRSNAVRHFHVLETLLENAAHVPDEKWSSLWKDVKLLLARNVSESQTLPLDVVSWQLRTDIAQNYFGDIELHVADAEHDRLASLAWWSADRFMTRFERETFNDYGSKRHIQNRT